MAMQNSDDSTEVVDTYHIMYFYRNICSPILAELFAKELRSSKFMQNSSDKDSTKNLYDTLKNVDSQGKRALKKYSGRAHDEVTTSGTYRVENLKFNAEELKQVQIEELLKLGDTAEAVAKLKRLDIKFLLCLLINDVIGFPHKTEVRKALQKLLDLRNSFSHKDRENDVLKKLWNETELLHSYLGKDNASFQKMKQYLCYPPNNCCQILEDVQQEINSSNQMLHHNHQQHLTIEYKQFSEHCQAGMTVENLVEFLVQKRVSSCQEPCPIVLCGEPGAGKSSILHSLAHTITDMQSCKHFRMVAKVDKINIENKKKFWEQIFTCLTKLSPQAVKKHGLKNVMRVLSSYTSSFLFLMDHNLQDTSLNLLIPYLDCGTWVLSYQGETEPSTRFHLLRVAPLSEEQVTLLMQDINLPEEDRELVSELYNKCEYKEIIQTPDMVASFVDICLERRSCVPFYMFIEHYIYNNVERTGENEDKLIELGKKAFHVISKNTKYYQSSSVDALSNISHYFLQHDQLRGYFFKYRKVEDYLAAKYTVTYPEVACKSWLCNPELFKTVFHITCALWRQQVNGIHSNLAFIKEYLKKLFKNDETPKRKGKKRKWNGTRAEENDDTKIKPFERWIFLSKIARDNHSSEEILCSLADVLTSYYTWRFKCTELTEDLINSLSLVMRHVNLTKNITIKLEYGSNVQILSQLWSMLSISSVQWHTTFIHLTIHYTESTVVKYEPFLAEFCAKIYNTSAPLHITKYFGPLLVSKTPLFFESSCMAMVNELDVYVTDLASLRRALEQQCNVRIITVRLRVNAMETSTPNHSRIKLSPFCPPLLTITYFEDLQLLLDSFEQPESLFSLKISEVYVHNNFSLNLTRFTNLKFLSLQFVKKKMENSLPLMPLHGCTSHLVQHLHLPMHVGRLLISNVPFFDDSTAPYLVQYLKKVKFQRLVLLDTKFSIPKLREILQNLITSSTTADTAEFSATPSNVVKRQRLEEAERKTRRKNKPEGKELIITSEADLFKNFESSPEDLEIAYHNFISLVKEIYLCQALSISFADKETAIRKDMCGDLFVQCPLPFLDNEMAEHPERLPELGPVLEALALAQVLSLNHTHLSHEGARYLLQHLKEKMRKYSKIEPFRLTIFSRLPSNCSKCIEEVPHRFLKDIQNDACLQQFNFRCSCEKRCHSLKKAIDGSILFNHQPLKDI